jgi:hypothetical protein
MGKEYVEAGWNTSTVVLASYKRRQKGNQVPGGITGPVFNEAAKYGYGSSETRDGDWRQCKLQTRPLVRVIAPLYNQDIFSPGQASVALWSEILAAKS